jgi:predicted permease
MPLPIPVARPGASGNRMVMRMNFDAAGPPSAKGMDVFSYPDYQDLRAQATAFEEVAAYHEAQVTLTHEGEPVSIPVVVSSASLFQLLRAKPLIGRLFTSQDGQQGAAPVAMIGEGLWRERFGADPAVIGKTIDLNNQAYTVIGVLPASLSFPPLAQQAGVWIPLISDPVAQVQQIRMIRGASYLSVIARLKPGVTLAQANAQLSTVADRLAMSYPAEAAAEGGIEAAPLARELVINYRLALLVLLAAVGLVLLIACANVASLLLARATARERELALRLALGAGRGKIVRQMVIESLELAIAGGAAGVLVAYVAVASFTRHLPPMLQEFQGVSVNVSVLIFAAAISIVAGVVIGLLPAWRLSDIRVHETLKGATGTMESAPAKGRLREALAVLEVTLAVVLLAGAGLLLRSFGNLVSVPLGFDPHGVLMAEVNLSTAGYQRAQQWRSFTATALDRVREQPGVLEAAVTTAPPMSGMLMFSPFSIPGHPLPPDEMQVAEMESVSPGYFRLMRIPLLRGRAFANTDTPQSEKVCIVNQAFVQSYFPSVDPLTQEIRGGMGPSGPPTCRIVGVVGNAVSQTLSASPSPAIYRPFEQSPLFAPSFLLRAQAGPAAMASTLRAQLDALDPALPVAPVTLTSLLSGSLDAGRLQTELVAVFAVLAVLLAAVGISGVLGYSVTRRTQEIGVRMALGATPGDVVGQVAREGLILVCIGGVVGLGIALWLTRWMSSLLFHVSPADPVTYIGAALVLIVVAFAACALPAIRASRVDPAVALRHE